MLSGETAIGDYPVRTVEFMSDIIEKTEQAHGDSTHTIKTKASRQRMLFVKAHGKPQEI